MSEVPSHAAAAPDAPTLTPAGADAPIPERLLARRRRPKVHRLPSTRPGLQEGLAPPRPAAPHRRAPSPAPPSDQPTPEAPAASLPPTAWAAPTPGGAEQSSLASPPAAPRGLSYAVDIVFCIDVTGSMTPILDAVKANALRFYDDVQANLTAKGKNVDELRVRVIAFRDFAADGEAALQESSFFQLPAEQARLQRLRRRPGPGRRRRRAGIRAGSRRAGHQFAVDDTRRPAPAGHRGVDRPAGAPAELRGPAAGRCASRVPTDFSALTDLWEDPQGRWVPAASGSSCSPRTDPAGATSPPVWENVVHHPSQAGGGLSDVDYGTIIDSIGNSV